MKMKTRGTNGIQNIPHEKSNKKEERMRRNELISVGSHDKLTIAFYFFLSYMANDSGWLHWIENQTET